MSEIHTSVFHAAEGISAGAFTEAFAPNSGNEREMMASIIDSVLAVVTVGIASGFHAPGRCHVSFLPFPLTNNNAYNHLEQLLVDLMKGKSTNRQPASDPNSRPEQSSSNEHRPEESSSNAQRPEESTSDEQRPDHSSSDEHPAGGQSTDAQHNQKRWNRRQDGPSSESTASGDDNDGDSGDKGRKFNPKGFALDLAYGLSGNIGAWMKDRVIP